MTDHEAVIAQLRTLANPVNAAGMRRFGIRPHTELLGISVTVLRDLAKPLKKNHTLALNLWDAGIHEARLMASFIADPKQMTDTLVETWAHSFDSWDLVDQTCGLFQKTVLAWELPSRWCAAEAEFVKRAGFVMIVALAMHDKKAEDSRYLGFLPLIVREAHDDRNFVRKAVNWALRALGKRSHFLNSHAVEVARQLKTMEPKAARWIGSDAYRELTSDAILKRLKR